MTELNFMAGSCTIEPSSALRVEVTLEDADEEAILDQIDPTDAVKQYGADTLLDLIGKDKCKEYFGLKETDND